MKSSIDIQALLDPFQPPMTTFLDRLEYWCTQQPNEKVFSYLEDGEDQEISLTYAELATEAKIVAAKLQELGMAGERALLLYAPGLDFVKAFFGCLYAGVIAVPAYPPKRNRNAHRIRAIAEDANAKLALTTSDIVGRIEGVLDEQPQLKTLTWLATDKLATSLESKWQKPHVSGETLMVLQYTSGSTGTPKGVCLSHSNFMHNSALISYSFDLDREGRGVSWLPTYHDMGLVGGIVNPVFYGRPSVMMSPLSFLTKPVRWLKAISKYRATISGGPNFAYDLCVQKIAPDQCEGLDLSNWRVAFNGAEPVRAETLAKFTEKFSPYGFQAKSHYPCYGMAETTLIIAGGNAKKEPVQQNFDGRQIDDGRAILISEDESAARRLVSCGQVLPDLDVKIVDTTEFKTLPSGHIGEIWVAGPSVAQGYWHNEKSTHEAFGGVLNLDGEDSANLNGTPKSSKKANSEGIKYLRTGDLGFLQEDQIYVTGRLKDMIIVRGVNRYPQDIELTVEKSDSRLATSGTAAFSIDHEGRERLVIVSETVRSTNKKWDSILEGIRGDVAQQHELPPDAIVLVRPGSIPKTSSGKIQRHACRQDFLEGNLKITSQWLAWDTDSSSTTSLESSASRRGEGGIEGAINTEDEIDAKVVEAVFYHVRKIAKERAKVLTLDTNIVELGLDSLERLEIATGIEETFGARFPEEVLQEIETVREVALAAVEHLGTIPLHDLDVPALTLDSRKNRGEIDPSCYQFGLFPEYKMFQSTGKLLETTGLPNPYFSVHEGVTRDTTIINGREMISFASYNYLSMSGDPVVTKAAQAATEKYGTSVSASRLVSGEKPIHRQLEEGIANYLGSEDAVVFVGGHATNETVIGHLFGPGDLILHDSLAHNSMIQGAILSGARRRSFPHNDYKALDSILDEIRHEYRRILIAIEGVYSMDGDYADVAAFVEVKEKHKAILLVDEAHSIGTMGENGGGMREFSNLQDGQVDLWMGTLSKTFGSCGGYIAGCREVVEYLKYTAPGFLYSVGIPPSNAAAAFASLELLKAEPERVHKLRENSALFLKLAKEAGLDTGLSNGTPVVPIITGSSLKALQLAHKLFERDINVQPILYPAVEEKMARLRFFITSSHTKDQIATTIKTMAQEAALLEEEPVTN
ncbi:MAG: aminotransferase class I/II-fold pyridoxal phosphate-dependent enzyme [Pirellulaceae bacterium]|nr:aminotransferase class I/II-fold pyridoxal phosphate-dependent enzyme [Pirellulaceae bacterium]